MSDIKTAPKKAPAKSAHKPDPAKDFLRAYEHQGRVEALHHALGKHASEIQVLVELGEQELADSYYKDAADLFRAAEHLSFGLLAKPKPGKDAEPKLADSAKAEFQHKLEKAQGDWEETEAISEVYQKAVADAQKAFDDGAYRKALELVRAAEALAHVHIHGDEETEEETGS